MLSVLILIWIVCGLTHYCTLFAVKSNGGMRSTQKRVFLYIIQGPSVWTIEITLYLCGKDMRRDLRIDIAKAINPVLNWFNN